MTTYTESLNPSILAPEVYKTIKDFIFAAIDELRDDAREYGEIDLTISSNGKSWSYQTGDNSFMGSAYAYPHWAVTTIMPDTDPLDVYETVIDQLEELMSQ